MLNGSRSSYREFKEVRLSLADYDIIPVFRLNQDPVKTQLIRISGSLIGVSMNAAAQGIDEQQ
jgi:hypothetical protein